MGEIPATRASLLLRLRDPRDGAAWKEFVELYAPLVYWERTIDLSGLERGEKLILEIASNTTMPKKDTRSIGVQVRGIRLFRKIEGVAPAPER